MKDQNDKKTKELALEQTKRGRGRPKTGAALTPAQKQKAYRERLKGNVTAKGECPIELREALERLGERQIQLEKELGAWARRARAAEQRLKDIEKSNVTESKGRLSEGMQRIIQDVHDVADAIGESVWRIQRKARANGKWLTLKGSYWNEAKAEDALAEIPNKKGCWWRIIEVKSEVED